MQFLKNPDLLHWGFEALYLGEDEWGDWLALPSGSVRWKGNDPFHPTRRNAVFCAPRGEWWHLHYEGPGAREYISFVDIVAPITWKGDERYEMIDLDLDVALYQDGTIEVQDEDEFEIHQIRYGYSPEMIEGARVATESVVRALENRDEPFFDVADTWLAKV